MARGFPLAGLQGLDPERAEKRHRFSSVMLVALPVDENQSASRALVRAENACSVIALRKTCLEKRQINGKTVDLLLIRDKKFIAKIEEVDSIRQHYRRRNNGCFDQPGCLARPPVLWVKTRPEMGCGLTCRQHQSSNR